jgi:hypothetical protein
MAETEAEQELWVEDVASRLGLPVGMLIRRIEAGTLPAVAVASPEGVRYRLQPAPGATSVADAPVPSSAVEEPGVDSRALVAGLLDRWERTMERRLVAERRVDELERGEHEAALRRVEADLREARRRLEAVDAEHSRERAARDRAINAQSGEIAALRSLVQRSAEQVRAIARLTADVADRDRAIADLHAQLVRRDADIDRLRTELEAAGRRGGLLRRR